MRVAVRVFCTYVLQCWAEFFSKIFLCGDFDVGLECEHDLWRGYLDPVRFHLCRELLHAFHICSDLLAEVKYKVDDLQRLREDICRWRAVGTVDGCLYRFLECIFVEAFVIAIYLS